MYKNGNFIRSLSSEQPGRESWLFFLASFLFVIPLIGLLELTKDTNSFYHFGKTGEG